MTYNSVIGFYRANSKADLQSFLCIHFSTVQPTEASPQLCNVMVSACSTLLIALLLGRTFISNGRRCAPITIIIAMGIITLLLVPLSVILDSHFCFYIFVALLLCLTYLRNKYGCVLIYVGMHHLSNYPSNLCISKHVDNHCSII